MKRILVALAGIITLLVIAFLLLNTPLPSGEPGPDAENLADKILAATNAEMWDSIPIVAWTFADMHHYTWHKKLHVAKVVWDEYEVVLNLNTQQGEALRNGSALSGEEKDEVINNAYSYWCNDSFWLNAPAKIRDSGTERAIVRMEDGTEGLLITYQIGGVTPGDSYLWVTDAEGLPLYYRMWVSTIPVGGLKATWSEWQNLNGARIAGIRRIGPIPLKITNLKAGTHPSQFGLDADYFRR